MIGVEIAFLQNKSENYVDSIPPIEQNFGFIKQNRLKYQKFVILSGRF